MNKIVFIFAEPGIALSVFSAPFLSPACGGRKSNIVAERTVCNTSLSPAAKGDYKAKNKSRLAAGDAPVQVATESALSDYTRNSDSKLFQ